MLDEERLRIFHCLSLLRTDKAEDRSNQRPNADPEEDQVITHPDPDDRTARQIGIQPDVPEGRPCEESAELDNAINNTKKAIATRFDFRNSKYEISVDKKEKKLHIHAEDDGKQEAIREMFITAAVKRPLEVTSTAAGPGIGIQLGRGKHAGRILMPFNQGPYGKWKVYAVFSDDGGLNWRYGETAPEP